MNVLLINSNRFVKPWPVIPFGLCRVAAAIEAAGHEVKVLDLCFAKNPPKEIEENIKLWRPGLVGISIRNIDNCDAFNNSFFLDEIREQIIIPCCKAFSGPIVVGGPAVGINPAEILELLDLEYAIRGDGEAAIVEFLDRIEGGRPLDGMGGLVWRKDGALREDNRPLIVEDLDAFPSPKPHQYLDLKPYLEFNAPLQIQTKRGCPLACSYCTYNAVEGMRYRLRNPQRVADEVEELVNETGIRRIEFVDSTFNIPLGHAKSVLRALINKRLDVHMSTMGINPSAMDEELVDLLKAAGFNEVHLGVESLSDVTLKSLGKNFGKKEAIKGIQVLQERKIPFVANMILGAPHETPESLQETLGAIATFISPWNLVLVNIGIRVYNGSPIAKELQVSSPTCTNDNFLHAVSAPPDGITLSAVERAVQRFSFDHPNVFVELKDTKLFPVFLVKLACHFLGNLAPDQPVWRAGIALRRIGRLLAVGRIQRMLFDRKSQM